MEDPSREYDVQMHWDVRIPLRDGQHLSAIAYLPVNMSRTAPAIFTLTPYVAQTHHEQGVYFAARGYPFLSVDVRGRGQSDGTFKPIIHEAADGYDTVEWLARQPYCNGKVAMWGGSYMGYAQWATAKEFPPHLVTIVPVASPFRGGDSPLRNNIFTPYSMQWLTLLAGRTSQERIFADQSFWTTKFAQWFKAGLAYKELDRFLGQPSAIFQEWVSHPQRGEFWDQYNPSPQQYAALSIPVLTITGSCDANQLGALMHYREHTKNRGAGRQGGHYLVIGPWDHAGTRIPKQEFAGLKVGAASLIDISQLHLQWYAWTMAGGPKPQFLQNNIAYYVMGADRWRYAETLTAVTARKEPFYLGSMCNPTDVFASGSLLKSFSHSGQPDHYIYDPRDVSLADLEVTVDPDDRADHRMIHAAAGKHLVYHSEPFAAAAEISGFFKFVVWLSIDRPDTDFRASVYEIDVAGKALQLTTDTLRARYRESFREPTLVRTQEPLRYEFDNFMFVSRRIAKGSRLRLVIGPMNSIHVQKNYNSGGAVANESMRDAHAVTVKLFHDESRPSALYVPFGQPED